MSAARPQSPRKSLNDRIIGASLRGLNWLAGSAAIDRLGLRKATEKMVFNGTRTGFQFATATARVFKSVSKLGQPARLPKAGDSGLFDLTLSDEQQMLRDTVQQFATEQLRPAAQKADHDCAATPELLKGASDLGIHLMGIPEALGGAGSERSAMTNVLVAEAMGHGDLGLAVACLAPSAVSTALTLWGDEEQQATYLPAFAGDHAPAAALAITEPRALFNPFTLQTRARQVGEGYVLDGVKSLVPRAAQAEIFIVAAALEGKGPALFIVESSAQGIRIEAEPAMGLRAASTARMSFSGVKLPASALLAAASADIYAECIALSRLGWCALATGCSQAALDYMIPYVNERVAFGEPISHRQAVAFAISNMAIETDSMRLLTWRAASRAEQGKSFIQEAALARRLCADKSILIGSDAVQLLGGHGFIKEHPAERWYRDLRAVGLMEGVVLV